MTLPGRARIADNPFYVLGLRPSASRAEVEREGQKLLGMLELELKQAAVYDTPLGPKLRDADKVRAAMAELRDPDRRLAHELWATLPPAPREKSARVGREVADDAAEIEPWDGALSALGWRSR